MKKLGIVASHPIQYYSPMFRYLAKSIDVTVFYCHNPTDEEIGKDGFGIKFKWDTDLLSDYNHVFLKNVSLNPSLSAFKGCDTPTIGEKLKEHQITHVVIMGWYLKSFIQALWYCKKNKIKVAVRGDSQINPDEKWYKSLLKKMTYPLLLRLYTKILYVGERNKQYLLRYGAKNNQLIFSPHAIDQEFWNTNKVEHKSNNTKTIFCWAAKFTNKKRPWEIIEAFNEVTKLNTNTELWMIGTGELLEKSKVLAKDNANIKFLGFKNQTELRTIINEVNCIVLTSDYGETWGLIINEGFGLLKPAIVSQACGCSDDLIINNVTGFNYPMGNTIKLKEQLLNFAEQNTSSFSKAIQSKNEIYSYHYNLSAFTSFLESK